MSTSQKKKILYVITKSNWGGAQRYVYDLATSISKEHFSAQGGPQPEADEPRAQASGLDVVVAHGGEGELHHKLNNNNIRTIVIPHLLRDVRFGREIKVFFTLLKLFRQERPDIIHLNSSKIGGLGALAGRVAGVPKIIFTAHGWYFKEDRFWLQQKITLFLSWLTVLLSHKTIAVSDDDKDRAPRLFLPSNTTRVHNGIGNIFPVSQHDARKKISVLCENNIPNDALWIGTISELHKNKGLVYAIRAVRSIVNEGQNIIFVIIGDGEEKERIEQCIRENRMERRIFLAGHIENATTLLTAFDIFTLTSIKEGLPYTILEAGSVGLPVVASKVGGIPDVIVHEKTGMLVQPKNERELTRALLFLYEQNAERIRLGNALQENIKNNFTKEKMVKETLRLYR